jgi:hypothetical protein
LEKAARKLDQKVIMIVEDVHTCANEAGTALNQGAMQFVSQLVDLHNFGLVNVVFTASDFRGVNLLSKGIRFNCL